MKTFIKTIEYFYRIKNYDFVVDLIENSPIIFNYELRLYFCNSLIQLGQIHRAIECLNEVKISGRHDAYWNYTMAQAYQALAYENWSLDFEQFEIGMSPLFHHLLENAKYYMDIAFEQNHEEERIVYLRRVIEDDFQTSRVFLN